MSYQLEMERSGKVPKIDMPPIPEEKIETQQEQTEQETYEVHPEIAKEFPKQQQEEQQPVEVQKPSDLSEVSAKVLREKAKRADALERERDELMRKLYEIEASKQPKPQVQQEEQESTLSDDDYVEARYLKKYDKTIKELRDELRTYKQQSNISNTDARLKSRFPDIDKVVSSENLEVLRVEYPELADTIKSSPDLYNQAVSAYTLIKKLGISKEDVYQEDRQKAQTNAIKPRPLASVSPQQGDSPLSKANAFANGLTDELKIQLRKEMEDARRAL